MGCELNKFFIKKNSRFKFHNYLIKNGVQSSENVYELPLHKHPVFKKNKEK